MEGPSAFVLSLLSERDGAFEERGETVRPILKGHPALTHGK